MIDKLKNKYSEIIYNETGITGIVQEPKKANADLAIPLFTLAKNLNKSIKEIYDLLLPLLKDEKEIEKITFENGFLNILLNKVVVSKEVLLEINKSKNKYANLENNKKVIFIDYSSPNIAKNFSVGHLRSTVIGNSLKNIYLKRGYKVIGENYLGDWGTQFGKMVVAYKLWGNDEIIKKNPVSELQKLYVKFHEEVENDPSLEDKARQVFKEMEENNNQEYLKIWKYFRDESLIEFDKLYKLLNVSFDLNNGEAFYNNKVNYAIKKLEEKKLLKIDDGATIINVGDDIPPALIRKSDGTTLYLLRDIATIIYRYENYKFNKILYVVGNEQKLHFEQLSRIIKLLGYNFELVHINFGLVLLNGKKMSTRGGNTAKLVDVLAEAINLAEKNIIEKNPNLKNIKKTSTDIGVGAVIFNDLKNERTLDIDFSLDNMLKFEGQTGPYLQYTSVRINSILKSVKFNLKDVNFQNYNDELKFEIVKQISLFGENIDKAIINNMPSVVARYLLNLSQLFNKLYASQRFIVEDKQVLASNLLLLNSVKEILNEGLRLLGINHLEEM